MASSASRSTKNPPRKQSRTTIIDISSNEASPIQETNPIPTSLTTTLSLSLTPPIISQTLPNQPIEVSPLAPRALVFSTPPSSPIEHHPYLKSLEDIPPRSSNPPPPPPNQIHNQTLPQPSLIDFEPFFEPTNLSKRGNRLCAQPEPFMTQEQILQGLEELQDLSQNIDTALHNSQNVQNGLFPQEPFPHTSYMPPPSSYTFTTFQTLQTTIPPPDQYFHHHKPLSHLINPYGLKDQHPSLNHKNILVPISNALKLSSMKFKMKCVLCSTTFLIASTTFLTKNCEIVIARFKDRRILL
ncbi:hypothetical protein Tco_1141421 [Tanacetum coccineum]